MSKFDLRDISQRLTASRDTEAVVFEFLGYLQSVRTDWRASLAFYEVSRDALVNVYTRNGTRLSRRDLVIPVDSLPSRLVRKFFHPSAFFNAADRRTLLSHVFQSSPFYEPEPLEAPALQALCPSPGWQSCICLPLADREDMMAMLVVVSDRKGAFGSRTIGEIIPLKSMAALALAHHLYRSARPPTGVRPDDRAARAVTADFQDRFRKLNRETAELAAENRAKTAKLESLAQELENRGQGSSDHRDELERVKGRLSSLETESATATQHLLAATAQLDGAHIQVTELLRTVGFLKEAFAVLAREHESDDFASTIVAWFCEHFGVARCSLMQLDETGSTLVITAHRGIDSGVAASARVRIGQGIAGWVAHNRKPLFVRMRDDNGEVRHTDQDAYTSDSFICVPLVYNDELVGVLNCSNKRDGAVFNELDLDRAVLAGSVLAIALSRASNDEVQAKSA